MFLFCILFFMYDYEKVEFGTLSSKILQWNLILNVKWTIFSLIQVELGCVLFEDKPNGQLYQTCFSLYLADVNVFFFTFHILPIIGLHFYICTFSLLGSKINTHSIRINEPLHYLLDISQDHLDKPNTSIIKRPNFWVTLQRS